MAAQPVGPQKATTRQWLAVLGGTFGAFMAFIDIGITNASMQSIQGTLSTSLEETSWITTSYLIAEIIAIPLAVWFADIFSIRKYLIANTILFTVATLACGMATSLSEMIFARVVQGFAGGCFIPLVMTLIMSLLPPPQRPRGIFIFSMVTAIGPVIGPVLGGWITFNWDWTYSFTLQLIPLVALIFQLAATLDPAPMKLAKLKEGDWLGIVSLSVALGTFTFVMEEGTRLDWLDDPHILRASVISVLSLVAFVIIELTNPKPFLNLRLLKSRNYTLATIANLFNGLLLLANPFIFMRFLYQIRDYDPYQIGLVAFYSTAGTFFIIVPLVPYLMKRYNPRLLAIAGLLAMLVWAVMNMQITRDWGTWELFWPQVIRALGGPVVMTALTTLAFVGVAGKDMPSATALFSAIRQLGGSLGIGLLGSTLHYRYRLHYSRITERIDPDSPVVEENLARLAETFSAEGLDGADQATQMLSRTISREAFVMAYSDAYLLLAIIIVLTIAAIALMSATKKAAAARGPKVEEHVIAE